MRIIRVGNEWKRGYSSARRTARTKSRILTWSLMPGTLYAGWHVNAIGLHINAVGLHGF